MEEEVGKYPGGKIEAGESSRSAGIREIKEELSIGVKEDQLEYIGSFSDKDISDRTKVIQIELFVCLIDDLSDQVNLNHENEELQWINIPDLPYLDIPIFGINKKMLVSVWREFAVARKLEIILDSFDEYSNSFPSRIEGIDDCELNVLYGFLSLLGIVQNTNHIISTSDYSKKIIEALICISRSGGSVFKNDNVDTLSSLGLTKNDFSVFSSNRNMMTYSHKAFLSVLSSMAEMKNSRRNVCDVLIFGQYQGKIYLLLRWDFYADKYQVVSAGLKSDFQPGEYEKNAKYVVSHRLGEVFSNGFEYFGMGQFSTKHFSGGSVDKDPILRTYYIDVASARAKREDTDAATIIDSINESTALSIEFSESVSKEDTKELSYYRWCDIDTLFNQKNAYFEKRVQGIDELISKLGESVIRNHIKTPIPINELPTEEEFDELVKQYLSKSKK